MTKIFNKKSEKDKRRYLRNNQTFSEKLVWMYLRKNQIYNERFLRQFSIDKFVVDFYCPKLHLAIEIDGDSHFANIEAINYDKEREKFLRSLDLKIIRFTNIEVNQNLDKVISAIEIKVRELQSIMNPSVSPLCKRGD
jgi:very-short-patch-repair endonuclease